MKVLLFTNHANDPLSFAIKALMRTAYTHAALLVREETLEIVEAFWPEVRRRQLDPSELAGIDTYDIAGLTPEQETRIGTYCDAAIAAHEKYSIPNLFRFLPFVRPVLGEAADDGTSQRNPVFCSQFVFDAIKHGGGINLLNANSYEVDPGKLAWSPFLAKAPLWHA